MNLDFVFDGYLAEVSDPALFVFDGYLFTGRIPVDADGDGMSKRKPLFTDEEENEIMSIIQAFIICLD